jgi:hypothetical protein
MAELNLQYEQLVVTCPEDVRLAQMGADLDDAGLLDDDDLARLLRGVDRMLRGSMKGARQ